MRPLYLSYEESLRMKKVLGRLEQAVADKPAGELNLHLARAAIYDLTDLLSPISRSRKLLEELLEATKKPETAVRNLETVTRLTAELKELYLI